MRGVGRGGRGGAGRAGASGQGEGEGREAGGEGRRSVGGQVVEQPLGEPHVDLRGGEEERGGFVGTAGVARLELLEVFEGGARKQPPTLRHLVQMSHRQLLEMKTNENQLTIFNVANKTFLERKAGGVCCIHKLISPGCRPSQVLTHFPPQLAGQLKHRR